MTEISVEKFAEMTAKGNHMNKSDFVKSLKAALEAKRKGVRCVICGQPIWAAGSGITGTYMCFTCTTGKRTIAMIMKLFDFA